MPYTLHHHHPAYFFFFNDPPTTEIYTLSLHDALPICEDIVNVVGTSTCIIGITPSVRLVPGVCGVVEGRDRKSTRLNSSHRTISYAVFCLKKKKKKVNQTQTIYIIQMCIRQITLDAIL